MERDRELEAFTSALPGLLRTEDGATTFVSVIGVIDQITSELHEFGVGRMVCGTKHTCPMTGYIRVVVTGIAPSRYDEVKTHIRRTLEADDGSGYITLPVADVEIFTVHDDMTKLDYQLIVVEVDIDRLNETPPLTGYAAA